MEQTLERHAMHAGDPPLPLAANSAVSWGAIIAGAFVASAASLILFALGGGLGFASVSPWPGHGASATTFAVSTAIWLIIMQWISSGLGGYITGRLRTRWHGTHTHEVFFRDTAHGLVTWAVASALVAVVLATSVFSAVGGAAHAVSGAASAATQGAAQGAMQGGMQGGGAMQAPNSAQGGSSAANAYGVDKLFRSAISDAGGGPGSGNRGPGNASGDPRVEVSHIVANAWSTGSVPDADRSYLATLVASQTGLPPADAQRRVDEFIASTLDAKTKAQADADAARKVAAKAAIYTALSMLVGAFIASVCAALGGRLRDEHI
jgi:hypothetical protein